MHDVLVTVVILYALGQRLDFIVGISVLCHLLADLAIRINDRGVVLAAKLITDLGQSCLLYTSDAADE